jgi:5'-nucleotidase
MANKQILITNDDGINSPGLLSAARALAPLGDIHIVAPREQYSGAGRSLPLASDGIILKQELHINGKPHIGYAVGGSPAQSVLFGVLEILDVKPDIIVSGINYGENVGSGITISGTIGAALEAAAMGIQAIAVSLETDREHHHSLSEDVDFSTAAFFTQLFSYIVLENRFPNDVDLLKIDIPCDATIDTPWRITKVSRNRYYYPTPPKRLNIEEPGILGYEATNDLDSEEENTDVYALQAQRVVSVSPISLDMTSRVKFEDLQQLLEKHKK